MTTLPKPARVEKWQRWRDSKGVEFTVTGPREDVLNTDIYPLRKDGEEGLWRGNNLLGGKNWTFLGYAKPDKVEVGQRWRSPMREYVVESVTTHTEQSERVVNLCCESGRVIPMPLVVFFEEPTAKGWEYLGMAESEGAKKEAPRPYAGLQSVIAAKTEYATVDDPGAPPVQTKRTADQARQDVRRANEEAAERLIAKPPEWAYPTAWRCAVLAVLEWANSIKGLTYMVGLFGDDTSRIPATLRDRFVLKDVHAGKVYKDHVIAIEAYARGMERPSPLMGRPGVKGGISTCDLGADYE